jgi:hypothetical protein
MNPPPFDVKRAHAWFAVELNNLAWDLVEAGRRSDVETERMIHAAHAACFHWLQSGDLLNHLRAQCLLATAYVQAGLSEPAVRHAQRTLALSREAADTQTAFDRATAHGCASAAYALAGRADEAQSEHATAMSLAETFEDQSDRQVFDRLYPPPVRVK